MVSALLQGNKGGGPRGCVVGVAARSRSSGFSTRGYLTLLDVIVSLCMAQLLDSLSFALRSRPESASITYARAVARTCIGRRSLDQISGRLRPVFYMT